MLKVENGVQNSTRWAMPYYKSFRLGLTLPTVLRRTSVRRACEKNAHILWAQSELDFGAPRGQMSTPPS